MVDIVNDKKNAFADSIVDERLDQTNFPNFERELPRIDLALRYGGMLNTTIIGEGCTSFQSRPTSPAPELDNKLQESLAGECSLSLLKT